MTEKESIKKLLHNRSLHATKPRLNLLLAMGRYGSAMPYSKVHESMSGADRVTVYRTLESLIKKGIIHKAYQDSNDTYYALCPEECEEGHHDHGHAHVRCVSCEKVQCQPIQQNVVARLPQWQIQAISVQMDGLCPDCIQAD
jgi:Fur family ferric uptake transcriptional regulator